MVCPKTKGFTLIELVMVMIIIGIISVVFTTRIMESSSLNQRIALSGIRDHIRFASDYAISQGTTAVVSFNVSGNSYSIYSEGPSGREILKNPEDGEDFTIILGQGFFKGLDLTGININGTNELKFVSYGTPFDANNNKLINQAFVQISGIDRITVFPVTGFCKVID